MKNRATKTAALVARILSFLKKLDRSLPLISPFAVPLDDKRYKIFLHGNTILIERPTRKTRSLNPPELSANISRQKATHSL